MAIFPSDDIRDPASGEGLKILTAMPVDVGASHFVEERRLRRTATGAAWIVVTADFEVSDDPFALPG